MPTDSDVDAAVDPPIERLCDVCRQPIHPARLEVLPETMMCVACARKFPPPPIDPETLDISQASPITRNGFAPKD